MSDNGNSVFNFLKQIKINSVDELKKILPDVFKLKKGEALERLSTPKNSAESGALGNFDAYANITGNALKNIELHINWLCDIEGYELSQMVDDLFKDSASRGGLRLKTVAETIKEVKPDPPNFNKDIPQPSMYGESFRESN